MKKYILIVRKQERMKERDKAYQYGKIQRNSTELQNELTKGIHAELEIITRRKRNIVSAEVKRSSATLQFGHVILKL